MRKLIIAIITCVFVLLVTYAGYRCYSVWKRGHMINLAQQFLSKGDRKNALLSLEQALRADHNNIEATRMMADLAEASRLPSTVLWRSRVVELNPLSLNDRLALAQSAITMRDYSLATNTLRGIQEADKKTIAYHNVAGAVAAAVNQPAEAEAHFLEAARLEPQNPIPQLNLAVVRLHGTNTSNLAEARNILQSISVNPTNSALRAQALRELAVDALRYKQFDTAQSLEKKLLLETNSNFADWILRLEILNESKSQEFKNALQLSEREAAANPGKLYELANWEIAKTSPKQALAWMRSLPMKTQVNQPAAILITESLTLQQDWAGLRDWLKDKNWAELEFVRHAFLSRALRGLNLADSAKVEWEQALKTGNSQKQSTLMLLNLASQWRMVNEGEELLWTIVNRYPSEEWARQALVRSLFIAGRTRSLMQLYSQEVKRVPSNLSARNNLAMTALLLDAQEWKPNEMAKQVYEAEPTNSSYASTYAYSLYLQKKNAEALKVMKALTPKELSDPSIAGYYALILKASGNRAEANTYFEAATKTRVLPEERKLFDKGRFGS